MNNRQFLISISLGVLSSFIGVIMTNMSSEEEMINLGWNMFDYGIRIGTFLGIIMLLSNGTFIKTKYFKISQGVFSLVIIGALFKIMHWTIYANHIIVTGLIVIMILYILSFLEKPIKKRIDYLKLIWVIINYVFGILVFLKFLKREYLVLGTFIIWLIIIEFLIIGLKNRTILKK
ncbi:conserved membrane hypothetical protein [Tenacibaculum sp. 190524A02b]|uniref:Gliding motility protein GldL-like N-terminal domain-containing protein n=1 Tax=Tenacibaculum vairaonense TaxID=3137860 RepID=A0ABP1FEG6_9FLAO